MSLKEIAQLREKTKHLYPKLEEYYYHNRDEDFNDYFKRFNQYLKVLEQEGIALDNSTEKIRLLNSMKFTLDFGPFGLHYGVFIPTIEFLGSD